MRWPVTTGRSRNYKLSVQFRYYRRCHWLIQVFFLQGVLCEYKILLHSNFFASKTEKFRHICCKHMKTLLSQLIEYEFRCGIWIALIILFIKPIIEILSVIIRNLNLLFTCIQFQRCFTICLNTGIRSTKLEKSKKQV